MPEKLVRGWRHEDQSAHEANFKTAKRRRREVCRWQSCPVCSVYGSSNAMTSQVAIPAATANTGAENSTQNIDQDQNLRQKHPRVENKHRSNSSSSSSSNDTDN